MNESPAPQRPSPTRAVLVTHTHWDREWYLSVEETRFRLVELIDRLLAVLEAEPDYHSFWLDGQTIPIEDYLVARPERAQALQQRLRQNKIRVGPWYVLADELLVSGEACIRNLLFGRQLARACGQTPTVGYAPDDFGHIDQLPQILRGFGLDNAVFWRGYSPDQIDVAETLWSGRDGSSVKAVCLVGGYSNARGITADLDATADRLDAQMENLKRYCGSGVLLLMNGIDHALPLAGVAEVIRKIEARYPGLSVRHGSVEDYLELIADAHAKGRPLSGELFQVAALDGCLSNRPDQKRLNRLLENRLAHYAEPLALLAGRITEAIPPSLIERAWKLLVKCHPHDTICGCHADPVARDMVARLERGLEIAAETEARAIPALLGCRHGAGPAALPCQIALFNPLPWPRDEIIELDLPLPPHSGDLRLSDAAGQLLPSRILKVRPGYHSEFHDFKIPTRTPCNVTRVRFEARRLAPMAVSVITVTAAPRAVMNIMDTGSKTEGATGLATLASPTNILENARLRATVHADGSLDLLDKRSGTFLPGLNQLRFEADRGDLYRFAPSLEGEVTAIASGDVTRTDDTALCQAVRVRATLNVQGQSIPVRIAIALPGDKGRLEITVDFENTARDFRLQAAFPVPAAGTALAHTPFSLSPRRPAPPLETALCDRGERLRINTVSQPMHYMAAFDLAGGQSLALLNRGLYEYTWENPHQPCLTLMRAVGKITTELAGHEAGSGQCPGPRSFAYALAVCPTEAPHLALREAFEYNLPPAAHPLFGPPARTPEEGFEFLNPHWMPAAFKRSEDGTAHVLRFWNASEGDQEGVIRLPPAYSQARLARLDETPIRPLTVRDRALSLSAKPFEIVTVLLA